MVQAKKWLVGVRGVEIHKNLPVGWSCQRDFVGRKVGLRSLGAF